MKIAEGNKLIAEFMGWIKDSNGFWAGCKQGVHYKLNFDKSWNELMPVVEKISNMRYPDYFLHCPEGHEREPYEDCAYPRTFGMRDKEGNYMVRFNANVLHSAKTLIEAAWLACVEFIKDYNEQNFITTTNAV